MAYKVTVTAPEALMTALPELLAQTDPFPLLISGNSMAPFLVHSRDIVYLSKVHRPLKRGDMILYRRDNGACVLHRIFRAEHGSYALVGDAQTCLEPGIRPDQVLALVTAVDRKGKRLEPGSFWWAFFEKIWIRMVPLRPLAMAVYARLVRQTNLERDT